MPAHYIQAQKFHLLITTMKGLPVRCLGISGLDTFLLIRLVLVSANIFPCHLLSVLSSSLPVPLRYSLPWRDTRPHPSYRNSQASCILLPPRSSVVNARLPPPERLFLLECFQSSPFIPFSNVWGNCGWHTFTACLFFVSRIPLTRTSALNL